MWKVNFFFYFKTIFFPIATVVAHSPTPSAVKTIASSNGEGKKHSLHGLNDDQRNKYFCLIYNFDHVF